MTDFVFCVCVKEEIMPIGFVNLIVLQFVIMNPFKFILQESFDRD